MRGYFLGGIDFVGLFLAITALTMAIRLVLRTEKDLDKAAKFLLANTAVLILANLTTINSYFGGIVAQNISDAIFHSSRIVALLCYIAAMHYLIKITKKN
jgi:hypothetical protein